MPVVGWRLSLKNNFKPKQPSRNINTLLELFQSTLDETLCSFGHLRILLTGDFNARLGNLNSLPEEVTLGSNLSPDRVSLDTVTNYRGQKLVECLENNSLILLNGRTLSDTPAQFTCTHIGHSIVDFGWISSNGLKDIKDLEVIQEHNPSDHFPVLISLTAERDELPDALEKKARRVRLKWKPEKKEEYKDYLRHSNSIAADFEAEDVEIIAAKLSGAIVGAAHAAQMSSTSYTGHHKIKKRKQDWFDSECSAAHELVKKSFADCKSASFNNAQLEIYRRAKRDYFKLTKKKKRKLQIKKLDALANTKNAAEFWKTIKEVRRTQSLPNPIPLRDWEDFYDKITPQIAPDSTTFVGVEHPELDKEFTMEELDKAFASSKNNKSPGPDDIQNEFLKNMPYNWKLYTLCLNNKILREETTPEHWFTALISLIHKKGDKLDPLNYRSIALINHIAKLLTNMINKRLTKWAEKCKILPESQAGFRAGEEAAMTTYLLCSLHLTVD
ncbi:uncharacterized protein LOC124294788 [Neodiprion lecontei]|uniref:Uncharacterized protein LOC124294788 n=1 Tax=Neodiprion lecontei TaxID=441921 RepID=A0ABM3GC54_NEOLC|nr:uncharacterized protein LOC124294788 [Neodiprion lecontei]